jgi:hypothetical protein
MGEDSEDPRTEVQSRLPRALGLGLFEGRRTERVERVGGGILVFILEYIKFNEWVSR